MSSTQSRGTCMARTYRRGRPTRDVNFYVRNYFFPRDRTVTPEYLEWYFGVSYLSEGECLRKVKSEVHRDGSYACNGLPRRYRKRDIQKLKTWHRQAILKGWKTGDWDLVLERQCKDAGWFYW